MLDLKTEINLLMFPFVYIPGTLLLTITQQDFDMEK